MPNNEIHVMDIFEGRENPGIDMRYFVIGYLRNNVYLIDAGNCVLVIDPAMCAPQMVQYVQAEFGKPIEHVVATHCHFDHVNAAAELRRLTGSKVYASEIDAPIIENPDLITHKIIPAREACPVDVLVHDGDLLVFGNTTWKVILTPGHSKGGICLQLMEVAGKEPAYPVLVSGDTLFKGTVGRTDFEGGSESDMAASMARLAQLPDHTFVLPGHGSFTTIGAERHTTIADWL